MQGWHRPALCTQSHAGVSRGDWQASRPAPPWLPPRPLLRFEESLSTTRKVSSTPDSTCAHMLSSEWPSKRGHTRLTPLQTRMAAWGCKESHGCMMDRNRDEGQRWMVREWRALTFVVEREVLALTLNPRTPMPNLIRSLRGGASACRAARAPSQGNQTKGRWLWEAPLTAQRASAEAPFPQPNDAVCPVPVHGPRATSRATAVCAEWTSLTLSLTRLSWRLCCSIDAA